MACGQAAAACEDEDPVECRKPAFERNLLGRELAAERAGELLQGVVHPSQQFGRQGGSKLNPFRYALNPGGDLEFSQLFTNV